VTDWLSWGFLALGVVLMFGPALWLGASSLKTKAALQEFPPSFLPAGQKEVRMPGRAERLPVFLVTRSDGTTAELALLRRIGLQGQFLDAAAPDGEVVRASMSQVRPVREIHFAWENYTEPLRRLRFDLFFKNSLFVTVVATLITLLVN